MEEMDLEIIIEKVAPSLLRYFCTGFSAAISEDLVQETLIRFITHVQQGKYDPQLGNHRAYAFGIAHYVFLEGRRAHRFNSVEANDEKWTSQETSAHENLEYHERRIALRKAIKTLSDIEQELLGLYLDQELTSDEMALILDLPEGTIKSHIHRAKQKLKTLLGSEEKKNERA